MKVLCVIPARGGSKGIPRKNLRPLAGKPMIYYSIAAALGASSISRVVVTTDDDEIELFSSRFGAQIVKRPPSLGEDMVTLDPVIEHTVQEAEMRWKEKYDIILTIQPTSPLVLPSDINAVIDVFRDESVDTVLSVVDDRHLCWAIKNNQAFPVYKERVNRQQLPSNYRETGAIIACTRSQLEKGTRVGSKTAVYEMPVDRSFDIDSVTDLYLCEAMLKYKKIVFTVVGRHALGLGHAYRAVMLAHELVAYEIHFVCEEQDELAKRYILSHNYNVNTCRDGGLLECVVSLSPDMVINDILDTSDEYITSLKNNNIKVVNFEDMGEGSGKADLVINALYPHQIPSEHVHVGPKYFCLRDEFLHVSTQPTRTRVERILITFGGTDEGNLTTRVLKSIAQFCIDNEIAIDVVVGPGFRYEPILMEEMKKAGSSLITYISSTPCISDYMGNADISITSGGRTVLELIALKVPTVVICQNQRETTHSYATSENGVINLGHRDKVNNNVISATLRQLIDKKTTLTLMKKKMEKMDLSQGKKRVIGKITSLFD